MPSETSDRDPVEVLGEEFLARRRRGEDPQIHEYIAANREFADRISALFPAMIAMEQLKTVKGTQDRLDSGTRFANGDDWSAERPIRLHVDRLERLGDYRIIREIGHGGMGIVYEAEQESLHRRVAVKVYPKQAIGDSNQLKRFQREAETAGGLHHTNIVPVFGVGQQDGLHYFVMQYIDGVPLDAVIADMRDARTDSSLDLINQSFQRLRSRASGRSDQTSDTAAVELGATDIVGIESAAGGPRRFSANHWRRIAEMGIQVADALHYAHRRGVTHRDIKPSNLILDPESRVWVTDFGLAVTHHQERLSRSGDVIGTLRYMSPEQLGGRGDLRSDVYGLGLTLYELTTMRPAFEGESRGSLIRKVANSSPPNPRSICRDIPRDLETIILKAIARSPESRYRSAAELADDLSRFRDDRPVRARRIGPLLRLSRWGRRNPPLAGLSIALLFCAVFSFAAISWNWRVAVVEKRNAETEGARAETNLSLALGSMDRLLERFESDWMSHPVASESNDAETEFRFVASEQSAAVLEEALEFYDRFAQQNANSPALDLETAKAYRRAGDLLERLGRYDDALGAYRRSADTLTRHAGLNSGDSDLIAETASVLNRLALVLHRVYQSEEAKRELDLAKFMLTDHLSQKNQAECVFQLAQTNSNLGLIMWRLHEGEQSVERHRRAILLLEGLSEVYPQEAKYRHALARAYRNYYPIALVCNERLYADQIRTSAATILEHLVADFPHVPDYRCELSEMLTIPHSSSGGSRSRLDEIRKAVQLADELSRLFPSIPRYQIALARSLRIEATLTRGTNLSAANDLHARAVDLFRLLRARFPDVAAYRSLLARALSEQGITQREIGRHDDAICSLEEAVFEQTAYLDARPQSSFARRGMSDHLRVLAETLQEAGDTDRADAARSHASRYWKPRPTQEID